ncbi:MAG: phospholipid-binding protein [Prochloron sp. SP5CPC1]|nr:phospholipid-binding protein [Candidatus Paraprochloron terpiosi SP5CPC1]
MGWLKRVFGLGAPGTEDEGEGNVVENASVNPEVTDETIPPERVGLNGEYDQSGLAKRVVLAFDQDPELDDEERLWVAQTGGKIVLKGTVSSQEILDKMVAVASEVNGTTDVDTSQTEVSE